MLVSSGLDPPWLAGPPGTPPEPEPLNLSPPPNPLPPPHTHLPTPPPSQQEFALDMCKDPSKAAAKILDALEAGGSQVRSGQPTAQPSPCSRQPMAPAQKTLLAAWQSAAARCAHCHSLMPAPQIRGLAQPWGARRCAPRCSAARAPHPCRSRCEQARAPRPWQAPRPTCQPQLLATAPAGPRGGGGAPVRRLQRPDGRHCGPPGVSRRARDGQHIHRPGVRGLGRLPCTGCAPLAPRAVGVPGPYIDRPMRGLMLLAALPKAL